MINFTIENMTGSHIEPLAQIEKECFSTPWSEQGLRDELSNPNARFFVAVCDGGVAGYIGAHNIVGEVYITNVAVSSAFRKKGIAEALVKHLINVSKSELAELVTLEVRESNEIAQHLYLKTGFKAVGNRKAFYENPREDAVLMTKYLKD